MPGLSVSKELAALITRLKRERAEYVQQIAAIDKTFAEFGIPLGDKVPVIRETKSSKKTGKGRRSRGKFSMTGEESVIHFLKTRGPAGSAKVNKHWTDEGRGGRADNTLSRLVKIGKLKRVASKDERGSRYAAV